MPGVFISYRRSTSSHLARLIFQDLRQRGLDVFLDVETAPSGQLDRILLNQIAARTHFLLVLSRGSLDRCVEEGDWLRREIAEAIRLNRNIVPIFDEGFSFEHDSGGLPESLRSPLAHRSGLPYSHIFHKGFIDMLCERFLTEPVEGVSLTPTPPEDKHQVDQIIRAAENASVDSPASQPPARSRLYELLPAPFDLIEIPAGTVAVFGVVETLAAFQLAKYPVTNAQYALFIRAGGYSQHTWWTAAGWRQREREGWTEPRYWRDERWNPPDHPVVGVSWYEAVAYCLWLGSVSGQNVMLPTEPQWQRAAQGDDGRLYPWGTIWDGERCNNSVEPCFSDETTPVTAYAGRGDSPFGVSDMAGNVWEWCRSAHKGGSNRIGGSEIRVLRGGSWGMLEPDFFRVTARIWDAPQTASAYHGFRIACY